MGWQGAGVWIMNKEKIKEIEQIKGGLVYGLFAGLITQIIALITSSPLFSMFDMISQLILLIIIESIGWFIVYKLKTKIGEK